MRLLLLYDVVYPEHVGGVEHRNFELARALAARGHAVTLGGLCAARGEAAPGVRYLPLGPDLPLYTPAGRRSTRRAISYAVRVTRLDLDPYDLVETANIPYLHLFPLARRCRRARRPLIVNWHAHWGPYWREYLGGWRWPVYRAIERRAARCGDAVAAVSRLTAERVAADRGRADVRVLPNGVPGAAVRRAAAAASGAGPPLLFAGRLTRERRLDLLLAAVARLAESRPGLLLTLAGDGPGRDELEQRAAALGLGGAVRFTGKLPSGELWRAMGGARVAVQPSSQDSFGMFPLEAMAAGLPVVYCRAPGSAVAELVRDGVEGSAVEPDAAALAAALARLLDDEPARARLAAAARARAAEYDWEILAARVEAFYAEVLGGARGAGC
ncbi:MAG TPA: glycosyltransferase [Thermoanaerobaculia bacterium]|nr:glycosyltransferase [Thermoanaerobaculia bacterium]